MGLPTLPGYTKHRQAGERRDVGDLRLMEEVEKLS